jgi:hypothetical protein
VAGLSRRRRTGTCRYLCLIAGSAFCLTQRVYVGHVGFRLAGILRRTSCSPLKDQKIAAKRSANNGCGHTGTILDAKMPKQVIWPDQADCGGLMWTRTFS